MKQPGKKKVNNPLDKDFVRAFIYHLQGIIFNRWEIYRFRKF